MTRTLTFAPVITLLIPALSASQGQDHHAQMNARGAKAMGFDQAATAHHFYLYEDGGAIQVTVNDPKDAQNLTAIRSHLPHIAQMFAGGNFSTPMLVHDTKVPGTQQMAQLRDRITYVYEEIDNGARVRIATRDAGARSAIHEFLRFQITDHKTGDSLGVTRTP